MNRTIKSIVCIVMCAFLCAVSFGCSRESVVISEQEDAVDGSEAQTAEDADGEEDVTAQTSEAETDTISAFVCGAVVSEGVYEFRNGSIKNDALTAAGGFSEDADTSAVNLAEQITDGEKIYFPHEGEGAEPETGESGGSHLVNINAADADELTELPGIGETRAARIVEYRRTHGNFSSKDELRNVSGIGDSIYEGLEEYITVE